MANTDAPFGLRPVRHINGLAWSGATNTYKIASAYATSLFRGDPVKVIADGTIERAAANEPIVGVFMGCQYTTSSPSGPTCLEKKYWPASTVASDAIAFVCDDPDVIFEVQADDDSATISQADVGSNADILVGTGSAATGMSATELDSSTCTNGTAQLRILRLVPRDGNEHGDFGKYEVLVNEHFYKTTTGI